MSNADPSSDAAESRLTTAVADSRVVTVLNRIDDRLSELGRGERAARLAAWSRCVVTDSFVYHWLTTEPDPEVIVIDLREAYTVGPFIAILDRVVKLLDTATTSSDAVAIGRSLLAEFRAAPVRFIGVAVALGSATALFAGAILSAFGAVVTVVLSTLALLGLAGTQVTVSWTDIVDSRVGRAIAAALEPLADETAGASDGREG